MGTRLSRAEKGFDTAKEPMPRKKKSTLGTTLTALQKAEAQVEQLRQKAADERAEHLRELHFACGFASRQELIEALTALDWTRQRRGGRAATSSKTNATRTKAPAARKSKRARLSPEVKAEIVEAVKAGESGVAIAKRFSISGQTVQNIKKAAGLVQARKKRKKK
jgi:hypothetical protein